LATFPTQDEEAEQWSLDGEGMYREAPQWHRGPQRDELFGDRSRQVYGLVPESRENVELSHMIPILSGFL
jgi:hypothetical protein